MKTPDRPHSPWQRPGHHARLSAPPIPAGTARDGAALHTLSAGTSFLNAERHDAASRSAPRVPLREHVAHSVRRYIGDLDGAETSNLYEVALRELEIPLFAEVAPRRCSGFTAARCARNSRITAWPEPALGGVPMGVPV